MIKEPIIFDLWGGLEYEELEREGIYQTSSLFDLSASNTIHLSKAKGKETEQSVLKIYFFQLLTQQVAQRSDLPCQYDTSPAQQLKQRFFCLGPSGLGLWILTLKMTESMFCPIK